jgi:hypothetical protein
VAGAPSGPSWWGPSWGRWLGQLGQPRLGVDVHGPELEHHEGGAVSTDPGLAKQRRSSAGRPDREREQDKKRRDGQQDDQGDRAVEDQLERPTGDRGARARRPRGAKRGAARDEEPPVSNAIQPSPDERARLRLQAPIALKADYLRASCHDQAGRATRKGNLGHKTVTNGG